MFDELADHRIVLLDSCIWIYFLEDHPLHADRIERMLRSAGKAKTELLVSELSLMEIVTGPLRQGNRRISGEYQLYLDRFPGLRLIPISRAILLRAAHLRVRYGMKTPDAIIIATAINEGATLVVSNDRSWRSVKETEVLVMDRLK